MTNQVLGSDKFLRMGDYPLLGLVQSEDWAPSFNAQDIFEMGNRNKLTTAMELETSGSLELLGTGNTAGLLARMIPVRDGTGVVTGLLYDPAGGSGKNGYTLTEADLRECSFDLLIHERPDQLTFSRTTILPRCYPTSFTGRADTQGNASESFNFAGDFVVGAVDPYHDVRSVLGTVAAGEIVLADNTIDSTGWGILYVYVDERAITADNTKPVYAAFSSTPTEEHHILITGMTVPAKALCRAIIYKKTSPSTTFPTLNNSDRGTSAFFIRGWQADIFLAPADAANPTESEKWLKVQSIDWTIDLRVETLKQIAKNTELGTTTYCRAPTFPIDISANVSVLEADWADWKALLTKSFTGTDPLNHTYDFSPANLKDSFAIVVKYYTKSGTLLQTWRFTDMRVDSNGQRASVGGRSEISWGFRGTAFTLIGANA